MSHSNIRFLRGSMLAEYMPCSLDSAHYSRQGNRTKTYSSWDIHKKLLCLFIPHVAMQRNPFGGIAELPWRNQPAVLFIAMWPTEAQEERNIQCFLSPLLWQVMLAFSAISTQDTILQLKGAIWKEVSFLPHSNLKPNPVSETLVLLVSIK